MSGSKDPGAALSGLEPRAAGQLQGSGGGDRETEVREWKEGPEGRGIFGWAGAGAGPGRVGVAEELREAQSPTSR